MKIVACSTCCAFNSCKAGNIIGPSFTALECRRFAYSANDVIAASSYNQSEGFAVVNSGLLCKAIYTDSGKILPSFIVGAGDLFDPSAFFTHIYAPSHVIAITDIQFCVIDRKAVIAALENNRAAMKEMFAISLNIQGAQFRTIWILSGERTINKVERLLSDLTIKSGLENGFRLDNTISISQDFIAQFISAERATVTRCLHDLCEQGYISLKRRAITIESSFLNSEVHLSNPWLNEYAYSIRGLHPKKYH